MRIVHRDGQDGPRQRRARLPRAQASSLLALLLA